MSSKKSSSHTGHHPLKDTKIPFSSDARLVSRVEPGVNLSIDIYVRINLEYKHWISVNWTVTENQSSAILIHLANKIATVTQHMNHEIPIGIGLLGFAPGVLLGFYKG